MHFRVAITASLRSSQARTALLTPTPPTRSAVSPTRLRKEPSRSTIRWIPGAASSKVRTSQPPSRNRSESDSRTAAACPPAGSRTAYWW